MGLAMMVGEEAEVEVTVDGVEEDVVSIPRRKSKIFWKGFEGVVILLSVLVQSSVTEYRLRHRRFKQTA